GMFTRNGRMAVSGFSAAAGVDESVTDDMVAMATTPILIAQLRCASRFMRALLDSMTPDARRGIYQTKVSTIPLYCPRLATRNRSVWDRIYCSRRKRPTFRGRHLRPPAR